MRGGDDGKHHLRDIEGVPPIVIGDVAVVLADGAQPAAEDGVVDVEAPREVQVDEHSEGSLQIYERNRDKKKLIRTESNVVEIEEKHPFR